MSAEPHREQAFEKLHDSLIGEMSEQSQELDKAHRENYQFAKDVFDASNYLKCLDASAIALSADGLTHYWRMKLALLVADVYYIWRRDLRVAKLVQYGGGNPRIAIPWSPARPQNHDTKLEMAGAILHAQMGFFKSTYKAGEWNLVGVRVNGYVFERAENEESYDDFIVRTKTSSSKAWLEGPLDDAMKHVADNALKDTIIDLMVERMVQDELASLARVKETRRARWNLLRAIKA